jgi:NTE family protein
MMRRPKAGLGLALSLALSLVPGLLSLSCGGARAPHPQTTPPTPREIRPKIGLALGGGGARGFAHIGVLRVLEQEKIPIDFIAGTSVGSFVAALYADQGRTLDAEYRALDVQADDLFDYRALAIFSGGMVEGARLEKFLQTHLVHQRIEDMAVPFAAVAVDLKTGSTVVMNHGLAAPAVHASCAIPGVFVPVTIGATTYVDGGVTDPIPSDIARQMGADVVIALGISAPVPEQLPKNPVAVALHAVSVMSVEIARLRAREADVTIWPEVGNVAYDDFSQKKRLIEAGEAAARAALPEIRAAIAKKTRFVRDEGSAP